MLKKFSLLLLPIISFTCIIGTRTLDSESYIKTKVNGENLEITLEEDIIVYSTTTGLNEDLAPYFKIGNLNQKQYWYEVYGEDIRLASEHEDYMSAPYFHYSGGNSVGASTYPLQEYLMFSVDLSSIKEVNDWGIELEIKDYYSDKNIEQFKEIDKINFSGTSSSEKRNDLYYKDGKEYDDNLNYYYSEELNEDSSRIVNFFGSIDDMSIDVNGLHDNNEFVVTRDYVDSIVLKKDTNIVFNEFDLRKISVDKAETEIKFSSLYLDKIINNEEYLDNFNYVKLEELLIQSISTNIEIDWDKYELKFYEFNSVTGDYKHVQNKEEHFKRSNILFSIVEKEKEGLITESNIFSLNLPIMFLETNFVSYGQDGENYFGQQNNVHIGEVIKSDLSNNIGINLYLNNAIEIKIDDKSFKSFEYEGENLKIKEQSDDGVYLEIDNNLSENIQSDSISFNYEKVEQGEIKNHKVTFNLNWMFFSPLIVENSDIDFTTEQELSEDHRNVGVKNDKIFNYSILDTNWVQIEISSRYVKYFSKITTEWVLIDEDGDSTIGSGEYENPKDKIDKELIGQGAILITFEDWFGEKYEYLIIQTGDYDISENISNSENGISLTFNNGLENVNLFYDYYSTPNGKEVYSYMEEKEMSDYLIDSIDANIIEENIIPKMESTFNLRQIDNLNVKSISNIGNDYKEGRVKWYQIKHLLEEEINIQVKDMYGLNSNEYSITWIDELSNNKRLTESTKIKFEISSVFWSNTIYSSSTFSFKLDLKWAMSGTFLFLLIIVFVIIIILTLLTINSLYKKRTKKGLKG